ncbi:MAG: DEAD/DEAH box helicase, partial [Burkholderiales bacterium]|nr:DEAD/DEAH box helicase [Phycisphaerae bacterium]
SETTDALVRRAVENDSFFHLVHQRPASTYVRWLSALLGNGRQVEGDPAELQQLYDDVHLWLAPITDAGEQTNMRLGFILREPVEGSELWPIEFRLVGDEDEPAILTAGELWRQQASPLTSLGRTIAERQEKYLAELRRAMEYFPSVERVIHKDQPAGMDLSPVEAFAFMRSWSHALEEATFHVELPDWASPEDSELSLRLSIAPQDGFIDDDEVLDGSPPGESRNGQPFTAGGRVGLDSIVRFDWRIAIGQANLTTAEFEQLVSKQSPLVRFKDRWVQIDLEAARKAQETILSNQTGELTLGEAFRVAYGLAGDSGVPVGGLSGADWVGRLLDQAPDATMQNTPQPVDFKGELRPYQLRGLQWMAYLDRLGLGACLADDMGLGKTIQFIALLLQERENDTEKKVGPTLLFAPASVIGNWTRELERFGPKLKIRAHHGPDRARGQAFADMANSHDVIITGYALAHRDHEDLRRVMWHRVALDEAQKVKNPSSAASGAIRSIPARRRVALTGTPIENHLSELWSIMEVLNPGLLGSPTQFRARFVIPVEKLNDHRRGQLLREMIRPFVLRRTKQDPEVAVNLPSKMEMRVFCSLTPEQAAMYERITSEMLVSVENASGIRRRGLILAGLTRLKQVCDHPALLTENKHIDSRSGKGERLVDMLEEVLEEGDAALVFTQYREMGHLLEKLIRTRLNHEPLFLHGGVPVKDRDTMIETFQAPARKHRIFILSLRAGGLGLNLTAANHVFHFDRWWNPAVEAQATDRAHRIGQNKIVQVHKFVSIGTVEERIDKLLADKTALAENIVTSGDQWLTNLSTDDLKKYLALSSEAMEEN